MKCPMTKFPTSPFIPLHEGDKGGGYLAFYWKLGFRN